jgi:hypothetical protein
MAVVGLFKVGYSVLALQRAVQVKQAVDDVKQNWAFTQVQTRVMKQDTISETGCDCQRRHRREQWAEFERSCTFLPAKYVNKRELVLGVVEKHSRVARPRDKTIKH